MGRLLVRGLDTHSTTGKVQHSSKDLPFQRDAISPPPFTIVQLFASSFLERLNAKPNTRPSEFRLGHRGMGDDTFSSRTLTSHNLHLNRAYIFICVYIIVTFRQARASPLLPPASEHIKDNNKHTHTPGKEDQEGPFVCLFCSSKAFLSP